MKKLTVSLLMMLIGALCLTGALGETVQFDGDTITLAMTDEAGEPLESVTTDTIALLGIDDQDRVVVYVNETFGYLTRDALKQANAGLAGFELPVLDELETIQRGADRALIIQAQQALIDLGFLQGTADGSYGNMSTTAMTAFQRSVGLTATGTGDGLTQRLLFALAQPPLTLSAYTDPQQQFAAIADRTEANLEPLYGKGLKFDYDDISGEGFISNGNQVITAYEGADIDSYEMTLRFGFAVAESKGAVTVRPVLELSHVSVRRPLMATVLFKSGDSRLSIKVSGASSSISGSKSVETGMVYLTADGAALLAQAAEAGELKMRVTGKYQEYDVIVPAEALEGISAIGAMAVEMLAE